jgi:hypothetical protein
MAKKRLKLPQQPSLIPGRELADAMVRTEGRTLGDGKIENVASIRSGNSFEHIIINGDEILQLMKHTSRIFDRRRLPRPAPVPPPNEWII